MLQADAKTNRFREKVLKKGGIWKDIYGTDEKKVADMVREDQVDILVELTGHTANNKLGMMACRPAPVQVFFNKSVIYMHTFFLCFSAYSFSYPCLLHHIYSCPFFSSIICLVVSDVLCRCTFVFCCLCLHIISDFS